ncbi:ribosomal protein S18-alanine N-acetyltransferase [Weissella koreensis]|uniref:ribosomal protein S18-alanine N-acetyltransferase n=1 Tax=Weissella koreensis TaxID=165096 RepID=UPI0022BA5D48|nr:ribosomal protein S18-alanine N-acetyltransferase [Weissella koreensis]MCZ9310933.1 ribosomal protein S18-alanine N-acetyltransferase [Weissella koreensis]
MLKRLNKWWSRKQSSTLPVEVQNFVQTMTIGGQEYSLMVAQLNDAVDMFDIEKAAYEGSTPWPLEVFEDEVIRTNERLYLVLRAKETGSALAYIGANFAAGKKTAHITNIAVHPQWQNRGLAKALLAYVMSLSVQHHFERVTLEVREDNVIAQNLYEKLNFNVIRQHPDYYDDHEAALEMMVKVGGAAK